MPPPPRRAHNRDAPRLANHATLDASTVTHTTPTTAKQPRVKRGSHPAARRQRKRIAAARAAAAASESPPRPEETESEQNNLPRRSLDHYQTSLLALRRPTPTSST